MILLLVFLGRKKVTFWLVHAYWILCIGTKRNIHHEKKIEGALTSSWSVRDTSYNISCVSLLLWLVIQILERFVIVEVAGQILILSDQPDIIHPSYFGKRTWALCPWSVARCWVWCVPWYVVVLCVGGAHELMAICSRKVQQVGCTVSKTFDVCGDTTRHDKNMDIEGIFEWCVWAYPERVVEAWAGGAWSTASCLLYLCCEYSIIVWGQALFAVKAWWFGRVCSCPWPKVLCVFEVQYYT